MKRQLLTIILLFVLYGTTFAEFEYHSRGSNLDLIKKSIVDNDNNILASVWYQVSDESWKHELVLINREGEVLNITPLPTLVADSEMQNGKEMLYEATPRIFTINDAFYMTRFGHFCGVLEYNPTSSVEDIEIGLRLADIEIWGVSPNPASGVVTIEFLWQPEYMDALKVELFDYIGRKYETADYELLEYNSGTWLDKI